MSAPGSIFGAVVIAGTIGFLVGHWQGESKADEVTRKMVMYADLTPACEQMLRDGADAYNAAGDVEFDDPRP